MLGAFFAAFFGALTVYIASRHNMITNSTQISVLPYLLLMVTVLLLNPLCRLIRIIRAFSPVEITVMFMMSMVSSGLATYGLAMAIVPIVGDLCNPQWNTRQSEWNRYVVPFLNDRYFVAEPGMQVMAAECNRAFTSLQEKKSVYEAAYRVGEHTKLAAALESELAGTAVSNSAKRETLAASLENARKLSADSLQNWQSLRARKQHLPEWREVTRLYPPEIEREERLVEESEKKLVALEQPAFDKVTVFRRGLPPGESPFPGILPLADDDSRAYFGRLKRLVIGGEALNQIKQVWKAARVLPAEQIIGPDLTASCCERLARATNALSALNKRPELERLKEQARNKEQWFSTKRLEYTAQLKTINDAKHRAERREALEFKSQSKDIISDIKHLDREYKRFKKSQDRLQHEMDCIINIELLVGRINDLQKQLVTGNMRSGELAERVAKLLPVFPAIDISVRRYFFGQIPWGDWIKPLGRWALLIGLTYVMLMALNTLIYRQWAHNERLTYPLVELPKMLIGEPDSVGLPPVFRNWLFWAGAAISGSVLGWNLLCSTEIIPGLKPFSFTHPYWNGWSGYVTNTKFAALGGVRTYVFFTAVGLSFLVPKNISFSLWFFYVVYLLELLLLVWAGHGVDTRSFPVDWWCLSNFRNAQGQGALIIFAGYVLYKCRKYILCALFPASLTDLEAAERNELRVSSIAFLSCSFGLILMLWLSMGANLYYTLFFYMIILFITIALTRVVAEGGLLTFQIYLTPFHYVRSFFGFNHSWTAASLFAPLMVYYAILFLDIKAFISPAMANALKLREDYRLKRLSFHVVVALAIIVASVISVATALILCYDGGADAGSYGIYTWFYDRLPKDHVFGIIKSLIKDAPPSSTASMGWTAAGGATMAALLFFRQYLFWLPHPIGMVMLINGLMDGHWFSIFLGWLCNVAVTKYGNKNSFQRVKGFFIGLIAGELILIIVAFFVSLLTGINTGIDLNKH